ncbi:hypothetical protein F0562_026011 [Nyssa sinensis]|uniref:Uncharacterized protein n=1 Tax=Nyssa sinensis TaxID=561372 RepID=A0A5J5B9M4_9ASTE|nr:hypothetical protein F0562_026011 [Nyssa sinensis]
MAPQSQPVITVNDSPLPSPESTRVRPQKFPAAGAALYIPLRHFWAHHGIAPPVTIRNAILVFSMPPLLPPSQPPPLGIAPPVCTRQVVLVFAAPTVQVEELPASVPSEETGCCSQLDSVGVELVVLDSVGVG